MKSIKLTFCYFLTILVWNLGDFVNAQTGANRIDIDVIDGDDLFLPCEIDNPRHYTWEKDETAAEAHVAYTENRLYILYEEGLLLLNVDSVDGGQYTCIYFTNNGDFTEKTFQVTVVPRTEEGIEGEEPIQCGKTRVRGRIVGGRQTKKGKSPWTVLLWNKNTHSPFCGGSLVSRRWVVTAAHCFSLSGYTTEDVELRLGEHNINDIEGHEVTVQIRRKFLHRSYDEESYDSDIALLELLQPVTFTDYIIPICLPSVSTATSMLGRRGAFGIVTGWGAMQNVNSSTLPSQRYSEDLRQIRLSVMSQDACGASYRQIITNNMFCARAGSRHTGERDSCFGDSGGPFVMKDSANRHYLIGIVSWGIECAHPRYPGVYTKVSRFRTWILDSINSDMETCEESTFNRDEDSKEKDTTILEQQAALIEREQDILRKDTKISQLEETIASMSSQQCATTQRPRTTKLPTTVVPITAAPPTALLVPDFTETPIQCLRRRCWHTGGYRVWARCTPAGFCECSSPYYSMITCLPKAGSCNIHENEEFRAANPESGSYRDVYSCVGTRGTVKDVHVLSVYEGNRHTRPPTPGTMPVVLSSSHYTNHQIVVVFVSYEPVTWQLTVPSNINVVEVVLLSYYLAYSSVTIVSGQEIPISSPSGVPRGYGKDDGGGNTAGLLRWLIEEYGTLTSFTGIYRAESWSLNVDIAKGLVPQSSIIVDSSSAEINSIAWTSYEFQFENNFCDCSGDQYVKLSGQPSTGRYVGVVLCSRSRYKIFMADNLDDEFKNIADTNGHGADHCEFVGAASFQEDKFVLDNSHWLSPLTTGYFRANWGDQIQTGTIGGGMGSDWTGKLFVKWYECGVNIP